MGALHEGINIPHFVIALFSMFIVAFIMRSIACTVNDICDVEFDKAVGKPRSSIKAIGTHSGIARTKSRPLPSGRITYGAACAYATFQLVVALGVFSALLDRAAFISAVVQLVTL
jgi:4-hydroxybenzoate polyprenyltransferase